MAGQDTYTGSNGNENFVGTVGGSNPTLTTATTIDGGSGQDMLTATLNSDFRGFSSEGPLTNVETVSLINNTRTSRTFNANNVTGVETWNLDGQKAPVNLAMLQETGTEVNIKNVSTAQTTNIQFAPGVTDATDDAMTIGLDNVGNAPIREGASPTYAGVNLRGIENVTVNSTGNANYANLGGVADATAMTITGDGDLNVSQVDSALRTLDGSTATGDLDLDLSNPSVMNSVKLGAGDNSVKVSNLATTAKVTGGDGKDSVEITNATSNGRYQLDMNGVETLRVDGRNNIGTNGGLRLSSEDTYGLENLVLANWSGTQANQIRMDNFNDYALNVKTTGEFGPLSSAIINDVADLTLSVGGNSTSSETFRGAIVAGDASSVTINLNGTTARPDNFNGYMDAPNATALTINGGADGQSVNFATTHSDMIGDLSNISEIDINGAADVDLTGVAGIGQKATTLNVNASDSNGNFTANFSTATTNTNASLMVDGSQTGNNNISVAGNYSYVSVNGNVGDDTLYIDFSKLAANATLNVDLGSGGNDVVNYVAGYNQDVSAWLAGISEQNPDIKTNKLGEYNADGDLVLNNNSGTVGSNTMATVPNTGSSTNPVYDATGLQFAGSNNGLAFTAPGSSATDVIYKFGDTGTEGATITTGTTMPSGGIKVDMTSSTSDVTVDANNTSAGKFYVDTAAQGSSITFNLAKDNGQADKIGLSTPQNSGSGSWTMTYVTNFEEGTDIIYSGAGNHWAPIVTHTPEQSISRWLDLAGVKGYSNIQVQDDACGFSWTSADGITYDTYLALKDDGTSGSMVSLIGVDLGPSQIKADGYPVFTGDGTVSLQTGALA